MSDCGGMDDRGFSRKLDRDRVGDGDGDERELSLSLALVSGWDCEIFWSGSLVSLGSITGECFTEYCTLFSHCIDSNSLVG